nr:unnamed protein product [Callosobruchus analis]
MKVTAAQKLNPEDLADAWRSRC